MPTEGRCYRKYLLFVLNIVRVADTLNLTLGVTYRVIQEEK